MLPDRQVAEQLKALEGAGNAAVSTGRGPSPVTRRPLMKMSPLPARATPERTLISVVFPAPLGPTRPVIVRGRAAKSTPDKATMPWGSRASPMEPMPWGWRAPSTAGDGEPLHRGVWLLGAEDAGQNRLVRPPARPRQDLHGGLPLSRRRVHDLRLAQPFAAIACPDLLPRDHVPVRHVWGTPCTGLHAAKHVLPLPLTRRWLQPTLGGRRADVALSAEAAGGQMSGFFDGLLVIELADRRNQYVGKLLADGGARVIQVEPLSGSPGRHCGPFVHDRPDPNACLDYWYYNAGKESIRIDITTPAGAQLVGRLVETADIFVESQLKNALIPLDLDYETLAQRTAGKLIQASLTDFGQNGPWRDLKANDTSHMALGGPMGSSGYSDPTVTPIGGQGHQPWNVAGTLGAHAIVSALIERLTSGIGQYVDCSIHDCMSICTEGAIPAWIYSGQVLHRNTGQHASAVGPAAGRLNIRAADGRWVNTVATQLTPYLWANVLEWLIEQGVEGELADPRYLDDVYRATRWREGTEIQEAYARLLAKVPSYEAMHRAQGFGLTWSVIQSPEENYDHAHWHERGFFTSIDQPGAQAPVRFPRGPYLIDGAQFQPRGPAPALGEHTRSVLSELLGMDGASIRGLQESGAI
ncbi:MAG: CoA transferase [Dehalococcoidia bacterium]|nr:CoA transferase [Dehalococcoidia bacterium]